MKSDISGGLRKHDVLAEDELKRMSRQVREIIPRHDIDEDDRIKILTLFDQLFATATFPSLPATHRVAAWNTLCAFIDELSRSHITAVRELLWDHRIWLRAFDLYLHDSQHARPKSAKQLLVTLGNALRDSRDLQSIQSFIAETAPHYLENDENPKVSKAFLQLLSQLLSKDLLQASAIDEVLSGGKEAANGTPRFRMQILLQCLFRWAGHDDFGSVVGRCLLVVLDKNEDALPQDRSMDSDRLHDKQQPIWATALKHCMEDHAADLDQLRTHIFPILFKRSLSEYSQFLRANGLVELVEHSKTASDARGRPEPGRLLHAALRAGKELGLVNEIEGCHLREDATWLSIPIRTYSSLLTSSDRDTRIAGLSLVISSHSATRPFLPGAFNLLKSSLPVFFADNDAYFRSEVFSLVQRLLDRLRAITSVLARTADLPTSKSMSSGTAKQLLQNHRAFREWLLRFLTWELRPTASYQRHISALKSISIVARSGVDRGVSPEFWTKSASAETKWPFRLTILHSGLRQMLLDLLMDPFDDVRQTASSILCMYAKSSLNTTSSLTSTELKEAISRGEKTMLATGRADQADGVAHMYSVLSHTDAKGPDTNVVGQTADSDVLQQLMIELERMLNNAQTNLAAAAKRYPMHGILTSIQFILNQSPSQLSDNGHARLVTCLHRIWDTVKPVLCNDAPEGFELEDAADLAQGSSKDTLSYCWRALKESSLLLGTLVTKKDLSEANVAKLTSLCFTQLAELRHRGAFSTVAQTWSACCNRISLLTPAQQPELSLAIWYDRTFDILKNKTTINTRRSAGIPSLLCGLLIASKADEMVSRAFEDLSAIATESVDVTLANESSLPQVHALNCIKDILKNTRLGEQSERLVPSALRLAADSLQSEAWAIRNCGLMLFRGVIDRLLGTSDAYLEDDAFVQQRLQHPELLDVVIRLLELPQSSGSGVAARFEGVFPALQLLQRMDIPQSRQQRAIDAVLALTASPSWHVRDKAARTYAALIGGGGSTDLLEPMLAKNLGRETHAHGVVLCIKYAITVVWAMMKQAGRASRHSPPVTEAWIEGLLRAINTAWDSRLRHVHPVTRAATYDMLVEYMHFRSVAAGDDGLGAIVANHDLPICSEILEDLARVTNSQTEAERAIERRSAARTCACLLHSKTVQDLSIPKSFCQAIVRLAREDPDACSEFWRALQVDPKRGEHIKLPHVETMLYAAEEIMSGKVQLRLKCEIQRFLLCIARCENPSDGFFRVCRAGPSPLVEGSNQTYANQWLQLRALTLDRGIQEREIGAEELAAFISSCKDAVTGDGFCSRAAAAAALHRMRHVGQFVFRVSGPLACDSYLMIYDLLNDDDEDIRLLAAKIVSRMLHSTDSLAVNTHFEPIIASQHLLRLMLAQLRHDRTFAFEAFSRTFNTKDTVVDILHTHSKQDSALFAQEKQNLYIDDARETKAWSKILLRLPVRTIPKYLIRDLTFWVDEGLFTLTARLQKGSVGRNNDNGALGWTSKSEVLVLGLQVIYGVEVMFRFLEKGGKLPMEGSEILRRLSAFEEALETETGSLLWKWEVERVMRGIVESRVRLAWGLAGEVRESAMRG